MTLESRSSSSERPDYVADKVIVVTGAAGGFGRLTCESAARRGAAVVICDIDGDAAGALADSISANGGRALAVRADVTVRSDLTAVVDAAVSAFGAVDVMVNNAGIMPLAFFADHHDAADAWDRCIDINLRGVLNGIVAVHDQMIEQGRGQIINISSIYGNFPNAGAAVYSATKAAVNVLSEALRVESQGRIKVTVIKPTGVPATGLGQSVVNPAAIIGILGQNLATFGEHMMASMTGTLDARRADENDIAYWSIEPQHIADAVLHAIDQPWGVSISDVTVRASGEEYLL